MRRTTPRRQAELLNAARQAQRRKRSRDYVQTFNYNLEAELLKLQEELETGTYQPGAYRTFHIIFSTTDREPLITEAHQSRLYEYIGGIVRQQGGSALVINGMEDHVHLFAKLRQDKALSDMIRDFKAHSSGWWHKVFPELKDFTWHNGYGAFTVSASQVESIRKYVEQQKLKHRERTFKDEFISFLRANEIEFDN